MSLLTQTHHNPFENKGSEMVDGRTVDAESTSAEQNLARRKKRYLVGLALRAGIAAATIGAVGYASSQIAQSMPEHKGASTNTTKSDEGVSALPASNDSTACLQLETQEATNYCLGVLRTGIVVHREGKK